MAGSVEGEKVTIAEFTQKSSDGDSGGPDRVGEVLVGQADGEAVSFRGWGGQFAFEELKEI